MVAPVKLNFKIYQGSTFSEVLRWESDTVVYKPITAITKSAPVSITAPTHGIPVGWRTKITDVLGMKEINSNDNYNVITAATSDTISINAINSLSYTAYTSGGVLTYNQPVDLSGYTAKMQIRPKLDSATILSELTTENGGIVLDNILKTISLNIPATATALLDFTSAVYSLELTKNSVVTQLVTGNITLVKEITR